ncbi:MAG TPA: hypothetical protein VFE00_01890 [Arthrobacter sp.]|nr:hypothetical protein [Arthrobacter sp.]
MKENVPPVPPAPQYPAQRPAGYDQLAPPYLQQTQYAPYPPQFVPAGHRSPAGPPRPKSSGFRVASGIIGIVLGSWLLVPSIAGFESSGGVVFTAFLILLSALGNVTAGIVLLANQRGRLRGSPVTSLSFAGFALLVGLIGLAVPFYGPALFVSTLLLAAPVLIIMGLGLSREKRGA